MNKRLKITSKMMRIILVGAGVIGILTLFSLSNPFVYYRGETMLYSALPQDVPHYCIDNPVPNILFWRQLQQAGLVRNTICFDTRDELASWAESNPELEQWIRDSF